MMFLKSIQLTNFLSYQDSGEIELQPLNVIIGPNGSGKSNLIEAFRVLYAATYTRDDTQPILYAVDDFLWKGRGSEQQAPVATLNAVLANPNGTMMPLRYVLSFTESQQRFLLTDERIESETAEAGKAQPYIFYQRHGQTGQAVLNTKDGGKRVLKPETINLNNSILTQFKDPEHYPELTSLAEHFLWTQFYCEWSFGRYTPPRLPQKADLYNAHLLPNASNLGLVLNHLWSMPTVKKEILTALQQLYDGIDDVHVSTVGNTVQVFLQEAKMNQSIPATRLSDGTLRYLCLLAILCHPDPPPLICIEEPELGLHPDMMPTLVRLLREAATRTQLIVTTHSDVLVDALHDTPEAVLVAEKNASGNTTLTRLNAQQLKPWLEKYRLGELWMRGDIGGMRW